jgi:polyhydroxyalkanoate synthesis regulator phasin
MFKISEWVTSGIINGYQTGEMSFAKTTELTANYLAKGIITQEQAERVMAECPVPTLEEV